MKVIKKAALAAAIVATPVAGFAMEAMDDSALSGVTGQDGITITADTSVTGLDVYIMDDDGVALRTDGGGVTINPGSAVFNNAGALIINDLSLTSSATVIDIDMGGDVGDGTGNGQLNVYIDMQGSTELIIGSIQVADATAATNDNTGVNIAGAETFVQFNGGAGVTITIGSGVLVDVELGTEENNFATINGSIGLISIGTAGTGTPGVEVFDASSGASLSMESITITNVNMVDTTANIVAAGLEINTGTGMSGMTVTITDLAMGSGTIGDVYLTGLDLSNTSIAIAGH